MSVAQMDGTQIVIRNVTLKHSKGSTGIQYIPSDEPRPRTTVSLLHLDAFRSGQQCPRMTRHITHRQWGNEQ